MLTAFDVGVGVLLLISAILATARGFTREILSLATWLGAAAFAAYLYFYQRTLLDQFFADPLISVIVLVAGGFLVSLIVLHLITMRIADFVVDSRIGPLDRTLGFVFGAARGLLLAVIGYAFFTGLVGSEKLPSWAKDAKAKPVLEETGQSLIAMLPQDMKADFFKNLLKKPGAETAPEAPAEEPRSPATPAPVAPAPARP